MSDPESPTAPEFKAYQRKRLVTISYDGESSAVVVSDDRDRRIWTYPLTLSSANLELVDDDFICGPNRFAVPDDEYGLALAFVHFVNLRIPRAPFAHQQTGSGIDALLEAVPTGERFQYAVVNVGMFSSPERMAGVLAVAGENGWELVTVYDKASNWWAGMEKGFMLLKRRVPEGSRVSQWCVVVRN